MRKWLWPLTFGFAGALLALLTDAGFHLWSLLLRADLLTAQPCSDTVTVVIPMCVRPTSLTLSVVLATATAGLTTALLAKRVAKR